MSRLTLTQATAVAITGLVTGLTLGHTAGVIAQANAEIPADDLAYFPACTPEVLANPAIEACVDDPDNDDPDEVILLDDQEEPGAVVIADGTRDGLPVTASQAEAIAASSDPQALIRTIRLESVANRLRAQLARERKAHRTQTARLRSQLVNDSTVRTAIRIAAVTHGVSEHQMRRVAWCESRYRPAAVGTMTPSGRAVGLFQFMAVKWRETPYRFLPRTDPYASAMAAAYVVRREGWWAWECKP